MNTTSFSDATTTSNTDYFYRVSAFNAAGRSGYSTARAITPDHAPDGLVAVGVSSTEIDLKWNDNSSTEDSFVIERAGQRPVLGDRLGRHEQGAVQRHRPVRQHHLPLPRPRRGLYLGTAPTRPKHRAVAAAPVNHVAEATAQRHGRAAIRPVRGHDVRGDRVLRRGHRRDRPGTLCTDGTPAGTFMVVDLSSGTSSSGINNLTDVNGTLFFTASGPSSPNLWKTDGTAAGTVLVKSLVSGNPAYHNFISFNGNLYFKGPGGGSFDSLWRSDGTAAGTVIVKTFNGVNGADSGVINANGSLYFSAVGTSGVPELWKSDGTTDGTVSLGGGEQPLQLVDGGGGAVFFTSTGTDGKRRLCAPTAPRKGPGPCPGCPTWAILPLVRHQARRRLRLLPDLRRELRQLSPLAREQCGHRHA